MVLPVRQNNTTSIEEIAIQALQSDVSTIKSDLKSVKEVELVQSLTDEDMHAIAERIADMVVMEPVEKIAEFVARLYIAEKGTRSVSTEPMRQDRET